MDYFTALLAVVSLCCVYIAYRRYTRISITHIRSPNCDSFLLGHSPNLSLPEFGVTEAKWQAELGNTFRIKGCLGEDQLFTADPKALQHIFQTSAYGYTRPSGQRATSSLTLDRGVFWAEGEVHKRQRRVMLPAFGFPETKAFLPIFMKTISHIVDKWSDLISADQDNFAVLDVSFWMSKATLDAIGVAAFDYDFGSVENAGNPLTKSYNNLIVDAFSAPSSMQMFIEQASNHIPEPILHAIYQHLPGKVMRKLRANRTEVHKIAKTLLEDKQERLVRGKGKKDMMSLLVKANASENEKSKLEDNELIPQMRTIILAGHETTANSISWTLYELAKSPRIQNRMRDEIQEMQVKIQARGDTEFTPADFDGMHYTTAVLKETLRLYPIVFRMWKQSTKSDVIPLFTPITSKSGEVINEIPISKGTIIQASVVGYNVNKDVWGEDAFEYIPERWLDNKLPSTPTLGVYGNLLTFSAGIRSCIGWRFAVVEMQAFLIGMLLKFEFSIPEGSQGIRKDRSGVITPMVRGQEHLGAQLPLKLSLLPN